MEYGLKNNTQFDKKTNVCRVCGESGDYLPCTARKYVAKLAEKVFVYHCEKHTCPFSPNADRATEQEGRKVVENPDATPTQIQSNVILSKMRQPCDSAEVEKAACSVSDRKWISNEKQKMKKRN